MGMDVTSTGTDGDGYEPPRVRLGMDIKSAGTVGDGYNSHTRAVLYNLVVNTATVLTGICGFTNTL